MKKNKPLTHFEEIIITNIEIQKWRSFYMYNFKSYGYEMEPGYIQATIELLRSEGYDIIKREEKCEDLETSQST